MIEELIPTQDELFEYIRMGIVIFIVFLILGLIFQAIFGRDIL